MMKKHLICMLMVLSLVIVPCVSAKIFSTDDAQATISLKTVSSAGVISKLAVADKDLRTDIAQTVQVQLSKIGKATETKTVQLYPQASVVISTDFAGTTNIMQVSSNPRYPAMEVYYDYQKSKTNPWKYYFRVNNKFVNDKAITVYSSFGSKSMWLGTISKGNYNVIIATGRIPDWNSIQ